MVRTASIVLTLACLALATDANAGSLRFTQSFVEIPDHDSLDITGDFTIECWIKPYSIGANPFIVSKHRKGDDGDGSWDLAIFNVPGHTRLETLVFSSVPGWPGIHSQSTIPTNTWTHVAVTFDHATGEARVYLNGVLNSVEAAPGIVISNTNKSVQIGCERWLGGSALNFFDGLIDEVRLWRVLRTEAEIQATMPHALSGDEPGLAACWSFDEGSGQAVHDSSPNANHGHLGWHADPDGHDPEWVSESPVQPEPPGVTPPNVAVSASPDTLWPPNGKPVRVTLAGSATDDESGIAAVLLDVEDEYGELGFEAIDLTDALDEQGAFEVEVDLVASRRGLDRDGRVYTIVVYAVDGAGNEAEATCEIMVPHDRGRKRR